MKQSPMLRNEDGNNQEEINQESGKWESCWWPG